MTLSETHQQAPSTRSAPATRREAGPLVLGSGPVADQVALFAEGMPPGADQHLALLQELDVTADLGQVAVPTLVISPRGDLITTSHLTRELAAGIPGSRLVELDCGHAIAEERPGAWADLITNFLADH